jgi:phenylalanyl-tRNA synthetase beta chain
VRAAARNLAQGVPAVGLFELGDVFSLPGEVLEEERVALVLAGEQRSGYPGDRHAADFFDGKGALETVLDALGVGDWGFGSPLGAPFHPARSARVRVGGEEAGVLGELHPGTAERLDLPKGTVALELAVPSLVAGAAGEVRVREIPRFPPVRRDLAFVVDREVPAGTLREAIVAGGGELLESVELFDLFEGPPIPEGRKSLAFAVTFRAAARTLTDEEAEGAVRSIVERVGADVGGELRTG